MAELHDLSALEQGALIRSGEISPVELTEHYLERAARLPQEYVDGAFAFRDPDAARLRAREVAAVGPVGDGASPLAGVPTAIKDLNLTKGVPTAFGSPAFAGYVPEISDGVTLAIEDAGMISLGKTSTPEFGSPCYTEPEGRPPAVTPWDTTRMAGGSSGGAAAAVAAGLVPVAQGSDGGGSIRIPAACCGLVGLKPSRGRISGFPMYGDPIGLAVAGPIARTVADAAALLDVMAGRRAGDPSWAPEPSGGAFLAATGREPGRLRIGCFDEPVIADTDLDPEVRRAYDETTRLLASLGHAVEDIPVPLPREAVADFETCWAVLTGLSTVPLAPEQQATLRPLTRWLGERGAAVSGPEFGLAIGALRRHAAEALVALAPYDIVLTPTVATPPPLVGALRDDADPAADFEAQKRYTPWTSAWNVTGMPAISLPLHQTPEGLPVGIMLAARPAEEELLLSLAAQLEAALPWRDRRPPVW
ncbi:amidase [Pimelobacter simplex]|uniref:Putative amidase n=3 Tax=Nocardioides simplex TaxID=2045 RepID=A0A0A1DLQ8_NOCSI|nr:amidase [Pimelobacter simplex]AIY18294.1 putative amidase [Pimelobacter simplex]GEB15928.1 amidase [Pimelobacter simplex]SFN12886.1 amidase [Pimelobacter simplex]